MRVGADFIALTDGMEGPPWGRYFVHFFSFLCNSPFGKSVTRAYVER